MKYLEEYRNRKATEYFIGEIKKVVTRPWKIMEICGGQTHSLVRNGILELLPKEVEMIHGPGCPVCVTPKSLIDMAVQLMEKDAIVCSFGDMVRVPGTHKSLLQARTDGGDLRILYSPLEAVEVARQNPDREVVFFAVGFETTAPANALAVLHAEREGVENFSLLVSHVLVPPAMEAILNDEFCQIDAFLGAGHVCAIMGLEEYKPLAEKYRIPIVITGFEPLDLAEGIYRAVCQLEKGQYRVENQYSRVVKADGNTRAKEVVNTVFEVADREWRGIGSIEDSGFRIRPEFAKYDAERKFTVGSSTRESESGCMAGDILKGLKKPAECPYFGKECNPLTPKGAPMVSSEGACAAYYHYTTDHLTYS